MEGAGLVEVLRGGVVESCHRVHAAVCDHDGRLLAWAGDPEHVTFMRSAAKPFQAQPAVDDGVLDRFGLRQEHLAIACASHAGSARHAGVVASLLGAAGVPVSALRCGVHAPLDEGEAARLALAGLVPGPLNHNCSGNHALMLAHARARAEQLPSYLAADGPRQQAATRAVAAALGAEPRIGRDRCGMLAYAAPLSAMAGAYARLARSGGAVVEAMRTFPELVSGHGRLDTLAMAVRGVVCKGGARGVVCCGSATTGLGGALKVEDGDDIAARLAGSALVEAVSRRRPIPELVHLREQPLRDLAGRPVGEYRVTLPLYA